MPSSGHRHSHKQSETDGTGEHDHCHCLYHSEHKLRQEKEITQRQLEKCDAGRGQRLNVAVYGKYLLKQKVCVCKSYYGYVDTFLFNSIISKSKLKVKFRISLNIIL